MNRTLSIALMVAGWAHFGSAAQLTLEQYVQSALRSSGAVRAGQHDTTASRRTADALRAGANPKLELAPGIGFTNGNFSLSQEIDLFGRRGAMAAEATAELDRQRLLAWGIEFEVASRALVALIRLRTANAQVALASETQTAAEALLAAVRRRFELGEAPQVHVTRAEVEALRSQQAATQAKARQTQAQLEVESLLGEEVEMDELPQASMDAYIGGPMQSVDQLIAKAELGLATAIVRAARAEGRPTFSAGLATDAWSLDRRPSLSRSTLGFQITLSTALFDRGENRFRVRAAEALLQAAEARLEEANRQATLRFSQARTGLTVSQTVVQAFEGELLPKGEGMLKAMREGYAAGLINLVDVLEAQQALYRLRQEQVQAVSELHLAQLDVMRATLTLPGLEIPR